MMVKSPRFTNILRWFLVLFLIATGLGGIVGGSEMMLENALNDNLRNFLQAVVDTGYLFMWVNLFKVGTGILLAMNKFKYVTTLAVLPFSVNIFLYIVFLEPSMLVMGIPILGANLWLIYAYWDKYKPLLQA